MIGVQFYSPLPLISPRLNDRPYCFKTSSCDGGNHHIVFTVFSRIVYICACVQKKTSDLCLAKEGRRRGVKTGAVCI